MGELERRGQWWLPGHENPRVAGAFTFSPADGVRLKLDGWLDPGQMPRPGSENLYPSILGLTSDGNEVTLWDCWETGWAGSSSGSVTATLQADAAYIGAHFCGPDEPRFHRFAATYSGLHNWVRQNVFRTDYGTDNVTSLPRCRIEYAPPADLVADTSKGKLRVTGQFDFEQSDHEVHLLHSVRMEVESDQGLSLEGWLSRILSPLQNLLSLAAGRPVAVTGLFVYSPEISPTEKAPGDPIEVLCRARYCEAQPSDEWALADTVFTVRDMGKAFPEMMEQWLKIADELAAVCDMHFIVVYQPHTYLEHHFLSEVWALEAYHRRRYPNNVLSKAENRAKIRSILVGVPEEHHKWLEEQLAFSNEPRFAQRLEDLLKQADSAISPLVGDKGSFVRAVKDARTALVHHPYSPQRPASSTQPGQLHRLAWTLSFLVQALLLQELGFSSERSAELLSRNRRYVWLRRLARA